MARVLVTDDAGERILWDEHVDSVHMEDEHSGHQVFERLVWAVEDAETDIGKLIPERRPRVGLHAS